MNRIFGTSTSVSWNEPQEDSEDDTDDKADPAGAGKNQ